MIANARASVLGLSCRLSLYDIVIAPVLNSSDQIAFRYGIRRVRRSQAWNQTRLFAVLDRLVAQP